MRLCRFDGDRLGLVDNDFVRDVTAATEVIASRRWPLPPGDPLVANLAVLVARIKEIAPGSRRLPLQDIALRSPITSPSKIMAAPVNYRLHAEIDVKDPGIHHGVHQQQLEGVERPVEKFGLFLKANSSLCGPADGVRVIWPERRTDYEVELAVVIGKPGRNIPIADAMKHRRLLHRARYDGAGHRGSQLPQVGRHLHRDRSLAYDRG
jgi:2-keto-4-pentenoate hydratase/2-oxohepta-3-ene-1,7-dioic acid hydratase in catechol pathway